VAGRDVLGGRDAAAWIPSSTHPWTLRENIRADGGDSRPVEAVLTHGIGVTWHPGATERASDRREQSTSD
jgi:hypothetical protein